VLAMGAALSQKARYVPALRRCAPTRRRKRLRDVTIEDITELADVAPRTFFNHFSSKESAVIGADRSTSTDADKSL